MREPVRVYADTSVYGGCFDDEFRKASNAFFDEFRAGRFALAVAPLLEIELRLAPGAVRELFDSLVPLSEQVDQTAEADNLLQAYLAAGILGETWAADALHVATATVTGCRLIVSWNFRHIVHHGKIRLYNAVNAVQGYADLGIHSPPEVLRYED
ncbi:MAG: hypothetical protein HYU66_17980 [Armatimonadetes bacterium]|nr:hypothetical protein [Armatimonadota bacterium]